MALDDRDGASLEWGGDMPGGRQSRLDAAMAERRHHGEDGGRHHRPYLADEAGLTYGNLDGREALARVTEFRAVFPDWDES